MIEYNLECPGGEGWISKGIRLWWICIHYFHTFRYLFSQVLFRHSRFILPRSEVCRDETVVMTGGSRGISSALLKILLRSHFHVILGCRGTGEANSVVKKIRRGGVTTGKVEVLPLDLSSHNSIREFAYRIMKKDIRLTLLINAAGVKETSYGITVEGLEHNFHVNYLSHVFLTYLLLPKLMQSSRADKVSRVVNLTSLAHFGAYPDLTDLQMKKFYSNEKSYMDSMLLQVAFTNYLDKRLEVGGSLVRCYSVHPGFVNTQIWSDDSDHLKKLGICKRILNRVLFRSLDEAAESISYVALSRDLDGKGGLFISNNEIMTPHPLTMDRKFQRELWNSSREYLQIKNDSLLCGAEEEGQQIVLCDIQNSNDHYYWSSESHVVEEREVKVHFEQDVTLAWHFTQSKSLYHESTKRVKGQGIVKPYYEYFISNIFQHFNLSKSWLGYLEILSIFVIAQLQRFNSHFKLISNFE